VPPERTKGKEAMNKGNKGNGKRGRKGD